MSDQWDDLDNDAEAEARAKTQAATGGKVSMATELVAMADAAYELGAAEDGTPYAIERGGPRIALPLRGAAGLRVALSAGYHAQHARAATSAALTDALAVIEGRAASCDRSATVLRVGRDDTGRIVVDLGRADGSVVVVEPGRWRIVDRSPVVLRRTALTGELPDPVGGGSLDELRYLLPVTDRTWPLLVGWLVAALVPDIAHPVLALMGEQGSGKSTAARYLVGLVDPSPAPLRTAPRDVESWAVAAAGSWAVALDNLSGIAPWLSDALCRAVTGDGMVRRALYTDAGLSVLAYRRAVILTAIDAGALRGDLADRLVRVEVDRIGPADRRTDSDLDARYAEARPRLLGALLDLLADALDVLPTVALAELPRMADYGRLVAAVDHVTGMDGLARYLALGADLAEDVIDADPAAAAMRAHAVRRHTWTGTTADLLAEITPTCPRKEWPHGWPTTARALAGVLRRDAPALRAVGVTVTWHRRTSTGRTLTLSAGDGRDGRDDHPGFPSVHVGHVVGADASTETTSDEYRDRPSQSSPSSSQARDQGIRDDGRDDGRPPTEPRPSPDRHGISAGHDANDGRDGPAPNSSLPVIDTDADEARYPDLFAEEPNP